MAHTEGVLKTCLGQIRQALGETAKKPMYSATVHRWGYRFLAPLTAVDRPTVGTKAPSLPAPEAHTPRTLSMPRDPVLIVGREAELAQLQRWWLQALQGTRQTVAEVYAWFSEGFDTADLQETQELLEALA